MSSFSKYPAYKPAGVPWLQQVPEHWGFERAKSVFRAIDVKSKTGKEELLTVSSANGIMKRRESNVNMFKAKTYVGHKLCWPEDLVINSLWAWGRGLGFSREHGIISTAYGVYRLREQQKHLWQYLDYTLRSSTYQWELQVRSKGVWKSRLQLTDASFFDMPILMPPKEDAELIVRYLRSVDAKVKRYIRTKRKLIAALQEQKQAIIQRAVTRGLDPNVKLKPSGVEWLGEVPEHWEVRRIRAIAQFVTSGSRGWAEHYSDDGPVFLRIGNISTTSVDLKLQSIQRVKPPKGSEGERTHAKAGDVLLSITAQVGAVGVVPQGLGEAYVNQHTALIRLRAGMVDPRWVAYVLLSGVGKDQCSLKFAGGTKEGLGLQDVKDLMVTFPPDEEQQRIVRHIDVEVGELDSIIGSATKEISLMNEYHTRLIADVVTGAVDVREAACKLPVDLRLDGAEEHTLEGESIGAEQ